MSFFRFFKKSFLYLNKEIEFFKCKAASCDADDNAAKTHLTCATTKCVFVIVVILLNFTLTVANQQKVPDDLIQ